MRLQSLSTFNKITLLQRKIDALFRQILIKLTAVGANALADDRTDNSIDILTNII
jgi:hypothetical protein